jgi:phosphate transport system ATP-binding protein
LKERYTILAVSHSLGQAQRLADNVLVLHAGRLARTSPRLDLHDETTLRMLLTEIL